MIRYLAGALLFILLYQSVDAQDNRNRRDSVIQFSGLVVVEEQGELIPLPLTNILLKRSGRGTFADNEGFFSIVAFKGDVVVFSSIGFETVEFVIPDTLSQNRYSIYQIMTRDTINLPETVVYPWPSREHFKIEFLALNVPEDLQDRAESNLAVHVMEKMRKDLPTDGVESGNYYLKRQAESYYSFGQAKPMHILNPIAWSKFFKAWKNGDFKRKSEDNR
ncbi:MAG: carboxypeptidase-like regulatory domain-containing protein [Saprospiraceae bacterium]|nr:carboxypeptidase-like regulatory domain-containing protein [Saprospiraceae bacterium]